MEKEHIERKARYIDAYSLSDKVFKSKKNNPHLIDAVARNHNCEHEHFLRLIADESTADVVEVVRCKDCEYKSEWANDGSYPDYNFCKHSGLWCVTDSHFCSEGERKEGAEE